ncbi:hypothetical protein [Methylomarinum vadi]|uniref:hypothetical protein n=1 Tax=Methylomarinum vadi TaxID=438855 RepID=UPI0004DF0AD8|nr:hypothetical protein [Methylomarinum vadi]
MSDISWEEEARKIVEHTIKNLDKDNQNNLCEIVNETIIVINKKAGITLNNQEKIDLFQHEASHKICKDKELYKALKENQTVARGPGGEPWWDTCNLDGSEDWWD